MYLIQVRCRYTRLPRGMKRTRCTHKAPTATPAQRKINVSFIFRKVVCVRIRREAQVYERGCVPFGRDHCEGAQDVLRSDWR